ncbi:GNAT family N-acetyltransferase [Hyphococcus sp.]|uniref:GNAT family N-acetyltransferase n=1 Tax=Hyphococcus sp. TaxID=2038636 RepID=UPI002081FAA9|nr:MAG: hypothetical protein DHS20C04_25930 [Marinicaulis sp.]
MIEISISPLQDRTQFLADWKALYARAVDPSFFQSPAWMQAWTEAASQKAELRRIEARRGDMCVLLGAFTLAPRKPSFAGLRETWFQQTGEPAYDSIYAEYVDFLCDESVSHDIRRDAVCAILNACDADSFVFCNLHRKMSAAVFSAAAVCELSGRVLSEQPVYVCDLGGDAFMTTLSKSLRAKISRSLRLYEERGPLTAFIAKTEAEKVSAWDGLKALHKAGWEARGEKSVFENRRLVEFHETLARYAPAALHLFEVKAGSETIAVLYNFVHGDRVMNYQGGFKYEEDNRLAPGFVAHVLAAQHYQDAGFTVYDLLAGEAEYKSRLGRVDETLTSLVVERSTWRNKVRAMLKR